MSTVSVAQTSFVGGEWAPSLYARTDLAKYGSAVRIMKNMYPHPHGGASNRGGTQFIAETKDSSKESRLIPFQFSVVQSYVLEFGDRYMRVIKDGGQIVLGGNAITGMTQANPVVVTASHPYANGDYVIIDSVSGMTEVNNRVFKVANAVSGSYSLKTPEGVDVDGTGYRAYTSGGYAYEIYEIATPYLEADLSLLKVTQSADVLYITHPSYAPRKLSRTGHTTWTLSTISFSSSATAPGGLARSSGTGTGNAYRVTSVTAGGEESVGSLVLLNCGPGDVFTWSAVGSASYYNFYKDGNGSGTYGWIGQATSATFAEPSAGIEPDYNMTPPVATNPFSGASNYPGVCTFFEQRLVFARTDNDPQKIWGSVVGNFENMNKSSPIRDDDAYSFTINARQVNEIRFMIPMNEMILGTSGSEWKMGSGSNSDAVTPTSVNMRMQSQWGVSNVQPIVVGNTVLFIEGSGEVVRDLLYSLEVDGYTGNNLSILANHLFRGYELTDWCYQQQPDSIIWCVRDDGTLLGLTYYKEHEVWGWHRHETEGSFESVTCVSTDEGVDETYMIVNRTIDGVTKRYIERFMPRLPMNSSYEYDIADAYFVDCGLSYNGWNTTTANLMALTGSDWEVGDTLTLTASGGHTPFSTASVGRYYKLRSGTDNVIVQVTAYTSTTVVSVTPVNRTVPTSLQATTVSDWAIMATTISGMSHLEGEDLSALADGNVISGLTVSSGSVSLSNPAAKIHLGLGYTSEMETLDYEYPTETGTVQDRIRDINSVVARLENTRAIWIGPSSDRVNEVAFREDEDYGEPIELFTGDKEIFLEAGEAREGRLYIKNTDPVPLTILALISRMGHGEN